MIPLSLKHVMPMGKNYIYGSSGNGTERLLESAVFYS